MIFSLSVSGWGFFDYCHRRSLRRYRQLLQGQQHLILPTKEALFRFGGLTRVLHIQMSGSRVTTAGLDARIRHCRATASRNLNVLNMQLMSSPSSIHFFSAGSLFRQTDPNPGPCYWDSLASCGPDGCPAMARQAGYLDYLSAWACMFRNRSRRD